MSVMFAKVDSDSDEVVWAKQHSIKEEVRMEFAGTRNSHRKKNTWDISTAN